METWETLTMSRKEVPRAGLIKAALAGRISNVQGGDGDGPERPSVSASESPVPGGGGPGPGAQSPGAALGAPLAPRRPSADRGAAADDLCGLHALAPARVLPVDPHRARGGGARGRR